ncbi:hypothetical protein [Flavivirga jejuensis]|uniref:Lysophospholipase L1-like esterase n=1 Tax=Flavivirga jejuensis TaxID=870487 RepID=A0ABT8WQC6_9FLAO|nr:hypothetical protein [Flavivirga jejuensis]MDO5975338.1 hypothetical protein [Flavivirga jejuensis]
MILKKLPKHLLFLIILLSINSFDKNNKYKGDKILIDIGDSLIAGAGGEGTTMSNVTLKLLKGNWIVKNRGVGGENTLTIGARQGGIPMYIKDAITIPANGLSVEIPNGIYSSYNNKNIHPLIQGEGGLNPCYINGIECTLKRNSKTEKYSIKRNRRSSESYTTKPNTNIVTQLSLETKGIATMFIGQNGGYENPEDLLNQINQFVNHKGDENIIIITSHGNGNSETVKPIKEKYGRKLIDLKKYMSEKAIYDAIEFELLPNDREYPTSEDLERMDKNQTPKTLLKDGIHFNSVGYELLGRLRYKKGKELGYW